MRINELVTEPVKQISGAYQQQLQKPSQNPLAKISQAYHQAKQDKDHTADQLDTLSIKQTLQSVLQGKKIYEKELQMLKTLSAQIKSGAQSTKQDSEQLSLAVKTAAQAQPLSDLQQSILTKFLQEL